MNPSPPFTEWKDPPLPAKGFAPLRLAAVGGGVAIYQAAVGAAPQSVIAQTGRQFLAVLTPTAITGTAPPEVSFAQDFAMVPNFDIAGLQGGDVAIAAERFQGATNALVLGRSANGAFTAGDTYQDGTDYRLPRFVRGEAAAGGTVTAVIYGSSVALVSGKPLQPTQFGQQPAPVTPLAAGDSGVAIATAPPNGTLTAVALFAKTPGSATPKPTATGDVPGTLTLSLLSGGKTGGTPQALLGSDAVYAFDADAHGNLAVILASTTSGPKLAACDLGSGKTADIAWPQGYPASGTWIASPSVLAVPGGHVFALAFFEFTGSSAAGIRYAQIDLASFP